MSLTEPSGHGDGHHGALRAWVLPCPKKRRAKSADAERGCPDASPACLSPHALPAGSSAPWCPAGMASLLTHRDQGAQELAAGRGTATAHPCSCPRLLPDSALPGRTVGSIRSWR